MQAPLGVRLLAAFFVLGALASGLAFVALLLPGSAFERVWQLNPQAGIELSEFGPWAIGLMGLVCAACALSAYGLIKGRLWGLYLALGVLSVNLVGDAASAILRDDLRTLVGLPVGGLLIAYLLRSRTRGFFSHAPIHSGRRGA